MIAAAPSSTPPRLEALPLKGAPRVLMPLPILAWALYREAERLLPEIESGRLVAFNVARPGAKARLITVLVASIVEFLAGRPPLRISDEAAIEQIIPSRFPSYRCSWLARCWGVSLSHPHNLVKAGALKLDRAKNVGLVRRKDSPFVLTSSITEFLRKGRVS
jgi:hypothetical protein